MFSSATLPRAVKFVEKQFNPICDIRFILFWLRKNWGHDEFLSEILKMRIAFLWKLR